VVRYNFRVAGTRFIGVDLAWREGSAGLEANETGVAVIDGDGQILDAGWTRGVEQTIGWADRAAADGDAVLFVDAPLVVRNESGQRLCETQVGQRYGRWKVSANTTNTHSPRLAGVQLLRLAALSGWRYSDGSGGPPGAGRFVSETYPYATLVGAAELGYDTERPRYKRKPPRLPAAQWRAERAATCDMLIGRLTSSRAPTRRSCFSPIRSPKTWPNSPHRPAIPPISTGRTSSMPCSAPGPHPCGHATAWTAARSSACPPDPQATQQPR
jgi:hypothetical protein